MKSILKKFNSVLRARPKLKKSISGELLMRDRLLRSGKKHIGLYVETYNKKPAYLFWVTPKEADFLEHKCGVKYFHFD